MRTLWRINKIQSHSPILCLWQRAQQNTYPRGFRWLYINTTSTPTFLSVIDNMECAANRTDILTQLSIEAERLPGGDLAEVLALMKAKDAGKAAAATAPNRLDDRVLISSNSHGGDLLRLMRQQRLQQKPLTPQQAGTQQQPLPPHARPSLAPEASMNVEPGARHSPTSPYTLFTSTLPRNVPMPPARQLSLEVLEQASWSPSPEFTAQIRNRKRKQTYLVQSESDQDDEPLTAGQAKVCRPQTHPLAPWPSFSFFVPKREPNHSLSICLLPPSRAKHLRRNITESRSKALLTGQDGDGSTTAQLTTFQRRPGRRRPRNRARAWCAQELRGSRLWRKPRSRRHVQQPCRYRAEASRPLTRPGTRRGEIISSNGPP